MLQPRLGVPLRMLGQYITSLPSHATSSSAITTPFLKTSTLLSHIQTRLASHATQGRANGPKDSPGKRLGAKKSGEEYVVPGNIIFRQRGTKWFPGENCDMGRDHTIFAVQSGYVKYYRDPDKHPKRRYIGVAFERDQVLPTPRNAVRRRRLGMVAVERTPDPNEVEVVGDMTTTEDGTMPRQVDGATRASVPQVESSGLTLRPGYMYRESNYEIGRAAEKAGIMVRPFDRHDRWKAWRSRIRKIKRKQALRNLKNTRKKGGNKKKKAVKKTTL